LCAVDSAAAVTLAVMKVSLVYLLLRQVLQMLTQLARDERAKDVELLVLRHQARCSADRYTAPGFSPPIGRYWRRCPGYSPGHAGRSSLSRQRRCCAGIAS
jgi:hypothetical protein